MDLLAVGPYRLLRKIGEGGMGVVYEGEHAEIARRVAIKVLSGDGAKRPEAVARLLNEARAVNIIRHRGIVGVSDLGRLPDGSPYIVMDYLDGETLRARLRSGLSSLEALRIARQVGSALAAAHDKGILHRDLKPENIMLLPDEETLGGVRAIVLDFGIAKLADEQKHPDAAGQHTETGIAIGTATYMSPEQGAAVRELTDRSDVYALGVVLYQMLSGSPPFIAKTWAMVLHMHRSMPPTPLKSARPSVDARLSALVDSMLVKEPGARPPMRAVVAMLDELYAAKSAASGVHRPVAPTSERSGQGSAPVTTPALDLQPEIVIEAPPEDSTHTLATAATVQRGGRSG